MKNPIHLIGLTALFIGISACQKDKEEQIADLDICGIDGMRLQADIDGAGTCFSSSLFASEAEGELSIGGVNPTTGSVALLLNDLGVGTHAATDTANTIVLIANGVAYQCADGVPGTITITSHDEGGNHIKGSFSAQVAAADGSPARTVSGAFDVSYLEL